jgi:phosphoglycerate dehydrogenase-like enzyme
MRALIPQRVGLSLLGDLPAGVEVDVWDGARTLDDDGVAFWVPPWEPLEDYPDALDQLPGLQVVQVLTAGYDHVRPHLPDGVVLCNAGGVHSASVAEWVLATLLAVVRSVPEYVRRQDRRHIERFETDTLAGKRVLILGYGSIGRAVERLLAPLSVTIARVASRARDGIHGPDDLGGLLPRADAVVVLAPLSPQTAGLVDAAFLAALPDGALVVNAARGGVVDQDALLAELHAGRLLAALDVTDPDPLPPDHPLLEAPGLLYTPHVAGATRATLPGVYGFVGAQVRRHAAGEPLENVITP